MPSLLREIIACVRLKHYIKVNIFFYTTDELGVNGSRGELAFLSVTHKAIVRNIDETQREAGIQPDLQANKKTSNALISKGQTLWE